MPSDPQAVLVVDGDRLVVDLLAEVLTDEGYRVRVESNALAAIDSIANEPPAFLLLDLCLPEVADGTLLAQLRTAGAAFPIALMTTMPARAEPLLCYQQVVCVEKPFNLKALLDCIAQSVQPKHIS